MNHFSTADSAIPMPDITSTIAIMIPHGILMMDIHQMLLILTKASWSNKRVQSGYYSRSVPATELNSIRIINSISIQQTGYYFYSDQIRKSKGTNHCSINSKSFYCSSTQSFRDTIAFGGNNFHPSKSNLLSVISAISNSIQGSLQPI